MLDAIAGSAAGDIHRPPPVGPGAFAAAATRAQPGRLRIALSLKAPYAVFPTPLHPAVRAAVERLATALEGLGHVVEPAEPAYGVLGVGVLPRSLNGLTQWAERLPDERLVDPRTREAVRVGRALGGPVLSAARALERPMALQVGGIFRRRGFDVVLAPSTAQPPLPAGAFDGLSGFATDRAMLSACPYTWPWNVLGWPAVNVPAGFDPAGLPLGAQLLGPACGELRLIELAAQLEQVERWHERRPAQ
jgi:amidase